MGLARDGVTVDERLTGGADETEKLLHDPKFGVDVAFMHGGVVRPAERGNLVMLMTLYYEPLWIFYRAPATMTQLEELRYKRVAVGSPGSGVRAFAKPLLAANNITGFNTKLLSLVNLEGLHALPIEPWLADLDRIEQAAARIRTPASFASEAYTLREHIDLVSRTVLAKASGR